MKGVPAFSCFICCAVVAAAPDTAQSDTEFGAKLLSMTDGQRGKAVWLANESGGKGRLMGFDTENGTTVTIVPGGVKWAEDCGPFIAADGNRVVYNKDTIVNGSLITATFSVDWDGGGQRMLAEGRAVWVLHDFNTSLEWIYAVARDPNQLVRFQLNNSSERQVMWSGTGEETWWYWISIHSSGLKALSNRYTISLPNTGVTGAQKLGCMHNWSPDPANPDKYTFQNGQYDLPGGLKIPHTSENLYPDNYQIVTNPDTSGGHNYKWMRPYLFTMTTDKKRGYIGHFTNDLRTVESFLCFGDNTGPGYVWTEWVPCATPPSVVSEPQSRWAMTGETVRFDFDVTACGDMTYQWYRNGAALTDIALDWKNLTRFYLQGSRTRTLTLSNTAEADKGARFTCTATNQFGKAVSGEAVLSIVPDTIAPVLVRYVLKETQRFGLVFSEPVADAFTTSHYAVEGVTVVSANRLYLEPTGVELRVDAIDPGASYRLTLHDVKDPSGNILSPNPFTIVIGGGDTQAPSAPASLVLAAKNSRCVTLAWEGSSDDRGVSGYRIYRGSAQIGQTADTRFTDNTVTAGETYSYSVKALDAAGDLSLPSDDLRVDVPPPVFTVVSPAGGEAFLVGSVLAVAWKVRLDQVGAGMILRISFDNGRTWENMDDGSAMMPAADTGTFTWAIPAVWSTRNTISETVRIRLEDYAGGGEQATTGTFAIRAPSRAHRRPLSRAGAVPARGGAFTILDIRGRVIHRGADRRQPAHDTPGGVALVLDRRTRRPCFRAFWR